MSESGFWVGPVSAPNSYRLSRLLGAGGEGEVWRALSPGGATSADREVAIKISPIDSLPSEEWIGNTRRLADLHHPGLVDIVDAFEGPDKHRADDEGLAGFRRYTVMSFAEGMSLQDWIAETPRASLRRRLRLLRRVASALDALHGGQAGTVAAAHGDVKPSNIVVGSDGLPVLVDLGLSRFVDSSGTSGRSNLYAAPELRDCTAEVTPATDSYAFAVTVAQTLVGAPPPAARSGFLDPAALSAWLRHQPRMRWRPGYRHRIARALAAPPTRRPVQLERWLITPRRRALGTAAIVAALVASTPVWALSGSSHPVSRASILGPSTSLTPAVGTTSSHRGTQAAAVAKPKTPPTAVAAAKIAVSTFWPFFVACDSYTAVANPGRLDIASMFSGSDIRRDILASGGGAWGTGQLVATISPVGRERVTVVGVEQVVDSTVADPATVYLPAKPPVTIRRDGSTTACESSAALNYGYDLNLDHPTLRTESAAGSPAIQPHVDLSSSGTQFLNISVSATACDANYKWHLAIKYTVAGSRTIYTANSDTVFVFARANHATVWTGQQNRTGGVDFTKKTFSGSVCSSAAPRPAPALTTTEGAPRPTTSGASPPSSPAVSTTPTSPTPSGTHTSPSATP